MAKILVSVPVMDKPEMEMITSLYSAKATCRDHKAYFLFSKGEPLISRARNTHISMFLHQYKDFDYFMSIDSDLEILNCHASNNIFSKLVACNKDFVGGLYALKNPNLRQCSSVADDRNESLAFDSGIKKMKWLSTGCWCLKREVVEKMAKAYPELEYEGDDTMSGKRVNGLYIPFIADIEDPKTGKTFKKYLSEDWAFSHRWKAIGGEIWADTSIVLKHIGKYAYPLWNVKLEMEPVPKQTQQPDLPDAGFDL